MNTVKALAVAMSLATSAASYTDHAASNATTGATDSAAKTSTLQVQQIRNATAKIEYAGKTFLVDPFLARKDAHPGFPGTFNSALRNPTVELPLPVREIMNGVDAVIVSHAHLDHWDGGDNASIPKKIPLFVQHEADAALIRSQGFTNVRILTDSTDFAGVRLTRTGGQHGADGMYAHKPLAELLGEAMGIVFQAPGAKTVYIAGDTVWNAAVDGTLARFKPDAIILNTGDARLSGFMGSIIMGKDNVLHAYQAMPNAIIIATHMDAINHMTLSSEQLRDHVKQHNTGDLVRIPADGEVLKF